MVKIREIRMGEIRQVVHIYYWHNWFYRWDMFKCRWNSLCLSLLIFKPLSTYSSWVLSVIIASISYFISMKKSFLNKIHNEGQFRLWSNLYSRKLNCTNINFLYINRALYCHYMNTINFVVLFTNNRHSIFIISSY